MPNFQDVPLQGINSFNEAIIYSAAYYTQITGVIDNQNGSVVLSAEPTRAILTGEAVKTLVNTRRMILNKPPIQDTPTGPWYDSFFDAALLEGIGVTDLRQMGSQPITRGRFAQELLELALLRDMYNKESLVEDLFYPPQI